MKITKFLGLSFFLFAFIATSFPEAVHAKDAEAVLDIFDVAVLADARYLIITPSAENTTHAVTASGIFVELSTLNESLPVTFSATESNDSVIRVGNYLTVSFDTASSTPMWMIASSPTAEGYVVTTGGVDRLNQFMITKSQDHDRFYQLSFCPKGEPFCECPNSVPVGVHGTDKNLVPGAGPLLVKFERI